MYDFENEFNDYYDEEEAKDQATAELEQEQADRAAYEADQEARWQAEQDEQDRLLSSVDAPMLPDGDQEEEPF
jgi:hypothetical protein